MYQYNDLTLVTKRLLACASLLLAGLLATGCATTDQPDQALSPAPAQTTRLPQTPPPQTRRVSDQELRAAVREDVPLRYVVKPGDTLWDIADYFMIKPWYWPELWHDNSRIENPHLIYPGDVLVLTHIDGRPRIKLSPRVRELPARRPIPTIPADAISTLLDAPRLVSEEELKQAPYIVAFQDQHLLAGERMTAYVRGLQADSPTRLDIVRPDGPLIDPETEQKIGFLALPVGALEITRRGDDVATAHITDSELAAHAGDRLLPARTRIEVSQFRLRTPEQPIQGTIIATYGDVTIAGEYEVVVINRGARDGLKRGHLLQIRRAPLTVSDPIKEDETVTLPSQRIGTLMVFEADEQTALGVILQASHAVHELDQVSTSGS